MTILQKHLVFMPIFFVGVVALLGCSVMWLWNWLMPSIFGLPILTFWQSVGLLVLCRLLVGNIGFGTHHHGHHAHHHCCNSQNELRVRWESMTPEERKSILEKLNSQDSSNE